MEAEQRAELLKDEYIMLQHFYEDIDSKGLTIKGWAITVALAVIGTGIIQQKDLILIAGLAASLMFWYLEAHWRGLSHFFSTRIQDIERIFQAEKLDTQTPLQVYSTWDVEYQRVGDQTLRYMFKPFTLLPHAAIATFIIVLLLL
jgi:hypothetical protein